MKVRDILRYESHPDPEDLVLASESGGDKIECKVPMKTENPEPKEVKTSEDKDEGSDDGEQVKKEKVEILKPELLNQVNFDNDEDEEGEDKEEEDKKEGDDS